VDLFGSDDEEEDAEAARIREERLAEYRKKKEAKPKVAAKSIVTMDVKPWGELHFNPRRMSVTSNAVVF
jgi:elongation factor 1-beta